MVIENLDHTVEDIFFKEKKNYSLNLVFKKQKKAYTKAKKNQAQDRLSGESSKLIANL
jgi:hypothetical protein